MVGCAVGIIKEALYEKVVKNGRCSWKGWGARDDERSFEIIMCYPIEYLY